MEHLGGLIHRMPLTAFAFLAGCMAISALPPLNGFVSEWLTFQAILLSPVAALVGLEAARPRRRGHAGPGGGAGRRLLRQGVRRDLPRAAAHAGGGAGAGDRPGLAGGDVRLRRRSACWPASCRGSSSMPWPRWCRASPARACRSRARLPGCRSCRSPRAAAPTTACSSSSSSRVVDAADHRGRAPLRLARGAPRAGLGLRLSRMPTPPRSIPPTASPSRSGACSARWCSRPASGWTCRRRAMPGRPGSPSRCAI